MDLKAMFTIPILLSAIPGRALAQVKCVSLAPMPAGLIAPVLPVDRLPVRILSTRRAAALRALAPVLRGGRGRAAISPFRSLVRAVRSLARGKTAAPVLESLFEGRGSAAPSSPEDGLLGFAREHLKGAKSRSAVLELVRAYLEAGSPSRRAADSLGVAYYDGTAGLGLSPEEERQLARLLGVLEGLVPAAGARKYKEKAINEAVNGFAGLLQAFDRREVPSSEPPRGPSRAEAEAVLRSMASEWSGRFARPFDDLIREWEAWAENPNAWGLSHGKSGVIDSHTARNLGAIRQALRSLKVGKAQFMAAASSPDARALFGAFDKFRYDSFQIVSRMFADSRHPEPAERGLIANVDQNMGRHPGGLDILLSAQAMWGQNWEAIMELNEALYSEG
jgi:hypothetical protein